MRIGVISDTHGLLRPEALSALRGSDLIIHAGDVGNGKVLADLSAIAPVLAVRGNNDHGSWAAALPARRRLTVGGKGLLVVHSVAELRDVPIPHGIDIVVSGHSHKPESKLVGAVLFFNPGSAGPRRFKSPITVGELRILGDRVTAAILELTPGGTA